MTALNAVLLTALAISLFANWRMYSKIAFYEEWYEVFAEQVSAIRHEIRRIDRIGAMEADDEIGYFFDALKDMMENLYGMGFYNSPPDDAVRRPETQRRMDPFNPGYADVPPMQDLEDEIEDAGGAEDARPTGTPQRGQS